jgi:shikimate dehydrogenase
MLWPDSPSFFAQATVAALRSISDVDEHRAKDLAASVAAETACTARSGPADPQDFEVLMNATPLGMKANDAMPVGCQQPRS